MSGLREALDRARYFEAQGALRLAQIEQEGGPRCFDDTIALGHACAAQALAAAVVGMLGKFTDQEEPEIDVDELAQAAYQEYGRVVGFRNFMGARMPDWWALPDDIRAAWAAAVGRARR